MGRYEQPAFEVRQRRREYEIRRYESHLVAETTVEGEYEGTGSLAFRRLAGFIFGQNTEGQKMKMTVPVTHQQTMEGAQRYRFMMERRYSEETLPAPLSDSVRIVRLPAGDFAAAAFRGGRGEARFRRAEARLLAALERDGVEVTGPAEAAVYDGPMVPPALRRNEVLVPIRQSTSE